MSSYIRTTKHPDTGVFEPAYWLDDHFGKHHYGVKFKDGKVFDPEKVDLETTDTTDPPNEPPALRELARDDFTKGLQKILRGPYAGLPFDQTDPISVIIKQLTALHTKGLIAAEKRGLALSLLQPGLTPAQQTWIEAQLSAKEEYHA